MFFSLHSAVIDTGEWLPGLIFKETHKCFCQVDFITPGSYLLSLHPQHDNGESPGSLSASFIHTARYANDV